MHDDFQTREASKESPEIHRFSVDTISFLETIVPFDSGNVGMDLVGRRLGAQSS
jgi:hypothetical protein